MRILHFTGSTKIGGVASIVYELSKHYTSLGHHVDQMSMCNEPWLIDSSGRYEAIGVRTFVSKTPRRYSVRQLIQLCKVMADYDIVHVHQFPEQLWGALAAMLCRLRRKRPVFITTEHNTWNNRRSHRWLKPLDRLMYSAYDKIACISPPTYTAIDEWLGSKRLTRKLSTIMNGIDINKYALADNRLDRHIEVDERARYIVMVGRLEHPKDPFTLVRALELLPEDTRVILCGDGDLKPKVAELAAELRLTGRVHLLGNVDDVTGVLKGCAIGVLSSHWDGFGLVAAEYMAAGIPAVAADVEGLKDVVGDEDLLFTPGDHQRLAEILNRLLADEEWRKEKIARGSARVKAFSSQAMAEKYLALYAELLTHNRR